MKTNSLVSNLFWVLVGIGGAQLIRLVGNLILTRLLAPEMFGLMALVNAFILGATMFSDVGIRGVIINNPESHLPRFYNTAWSIQVVRGVILYVVLLALSFPLANFYDVAQLPSLIAIAAATTLITGLTPTKVYWQAKELYLKRLSALELLAQLLGMIFFIGLAYYYRSIWSLVIGTVLVSVFTLAFYHFFIPGAGNRWHWHWPSFHEIFRFGRWILLSTGSLYLISQGDRLVLGKFFTLEMLGVYSIAINFSMLFNELGENAASKFLFPLYRKTVEQGADQYRKIRKFRLIGLALGMLGCLPLIVGGQWLINLLYDDRYIEAGWMLQVLALAAMFRLLDTTLRPLFLAHGNSFDAMTYQVVKGGTYLLALILGVAYFGIQGLMAVFVLIPIISIILLHVMVRKYGYCWPLDDIPIVVLTLLLTWIGWMVFDANPLNLMTNSSFL